MSIYLCHGVLVFHYVQTFPSWMWASMGLLLGVCRSWTWPCCCWWASSQCHRVSPYWWWLGMGS